MVYFYTDTYPDSIDISTNVRVKARTGTLSNFDPPTIKQRECVREEEREREREGEGKCEGRTQTRETGREGEGREGRRQWILALSLCYHGVCTFTEKTIYDKGSTV